MRKIYLHGGRTRIECEGNKNFFKNIVQENNIKNILIVPFAEVKNTQEEGFQIDVEKFKRYNPNRELNFTMASKDGSILEKQFKETDLIYFRGGDTPTLKQHLNVLTNFKELIQNKTLVGNSAGAQIFSKYYYDNSLSKIDDGFGILDIKLLVHYNPEAKHKEETIKNYKETLPIYKIPECEYILFEN